MHNYVNNIVSELNEKSRIIRIDSEANNKVYTSLLLKTQLSVYTYLQLEKRFITRRLFHCVNKYGLMLLSKNHFVFN